MEVFIYLLVALGSYLFGSISFARLVARIIDPTLDTENIHMTRADGSQGQHLKTVGATTISVKLGPRVGCFIGILDILKGVVPVLALKLLYPDQFYHLVAAVFVVVGHNWPLYYKFRGGGGISPTYGGFFVVDFLGTIISSFTAMVLGFFVIRDILIAYTGGLWLFLLWLIIFKGDWPHIIYGVAINIVFSLAIIPDIQEYLRKKREGTLDMGDAMSTFPMGRGMLKIMKFFGTEPRKKTE